VSARVAFPGGAGAHSAAAAEALFPGEELLALPTFRAVADEVELGHVEHGVLPIESSIAGPVAETHDLLFESPLGIVAQTILPIRHLLVGPAEIPLEQVRMIRSHPVALEQCRNLLARLPNAVAVAAATTADAARAVAADGDPTHVAITSLRAVELHDLTVLEHDVGDHPEAFTRFVAITTYLQVERNASLGYRTSFSFVTDHRPGALHRALEPFARLDVDLHQLTSRPIPHTPWRYRFDAVLAGHPLDADVRRALAEATAETRRLLVSGVYPE
jgi:prephenate dehydratase